MSLDSGPPYDQDAPPTKKSKRFNGGPCVVCGSKRVRVKEIQSRTSPHRTFAMRKCASCGFVGNPDNVRDYREFSTADALPFRSRQGTVERKGREYFMAEMALEILGGSSRDVLVYGAGRSLDNHHIAALPSVSCVALADVMRVRDDADFVDSAAPVVRRFDVVVACEVVEHFLEPQADFAKLLDYIEGNGLLVCSTNVYDGGNLTRQPYIFLPGHTAYYTHEALKIIAQSSGFLLDLRVPWVSTGYGGPRKRYLLFTRSQAVCNATVAYFETHAYAPSEPPELYPDDPRRIRLEKAKAAEARAAALPTDI